MAREGFRQVGHMGLAAGMIIGGGAGAFQRGVNRAQAWQEACDANARRDDEVGAFRKLLSAFHVERARAETAEARVKALEAEVANLRADRVRQALRRQ